MSCLLNWALNPNLTTFAEDASPPTADTPPPTLEVAPEITEPTPTQPTTESTPTETSENPETTITITTEQQAEISNVAETVADSGNNESGLAESQNTDATISTGETVASVDVLNVVNTNIVDSEGIVLVKSGDLAETSLDLRAEIGEPGIATPDCNDCQSSTTIITQNTAIVDNQVLVVANSGGNLASSTEESSVTTGDAYAGANVVNLVNTNFVQSKYILLVFNNFGDWSGNLVLPNGNFFQDFLSSFSGCSDCQSDLSVANQSEATVANSVATLANSGENDATGENTTTFSGGSAAISNVYNQVNTNIYGDSSFHLLIKVLGDWSGNIFNLPPNIDWQQTQEGIILFDKKSEPNSTNPDQKNNGGGKTTINQANSALVANSIQTIANTGSNESIGGNANIETGDAYAASNVVNIVNTNIVSANWTAAIINVLGNWRGNISFGEPDLWVGTVAESAGSLGPGSLIKFTTTIKNNGDARASAIKVVTKPSLPWLLFQGEKEWFVSPLQPGESTTISYYANVDQNVPEGRTNMNAATAVSLFEDDGNPGDNQDTISLSIYKEPTLITPYTSRTASYPKIEVSKKHIIRSSVVIDNKEMVPFAGEVDYEIVVKNKGGDAAHGILFDQLKDEKGKIISTQSWSLGKILSEEEITINYTSKFNEKSAPGVYTNYAWVEALGGDYEAFDGALAERADSNVASDSVVLAAKPTVPELIINMPELIQESESVVLGVFTENVSLLSEPEPEIRPEILGNYCFETTDKPSDGKLTLSESVLLGLSFVLIIRKKDKIPFNIFLI